MNLTRGQIETEKVISGPINKDTSFVETQHALQTKTGQIFETLTTPKEYTKNPR